MLTTLIADFRYAVRGLARVPMFTAVAVLTLALGIGANTAIFSVLNGVLLQPLPFERPHELVHVWEKNPLKGWTRAVAAPANFLDWQKESTLLADLAAYSRGNATWTGRGDPRRLGQGTATGNLFSLLGVQPLHGRLFGDDDTWAGGADIAVAGYNFWRTHLGADPNVVGSTLTLDGASVEIVGVLPPEARLAEFLCCDTVASATMEPDIWRPTRWDPEVFGIAVWTRRAHWLNVIGRLQPGVTAEQALAELEGIAARLEKKYPETNEQMGVGITPLHQSMVAQARLPLTLLMAAVALVLLIACVNVANLLVARGVARAREISIRLALGAGRWRIIRQLLAESLLLGLLGGMLGFALALGGTGFLVAAAPADIPRLLEVVADGGVLMFAVLCSLATVVAFGLIPAWTASRTNASAGMQQGGRQGAGGGRQNLRRGLVVVEVALSLVLVAASGLLLRSLLELHTVDPGYDPSSVLSAEIDLPPTYDQAPAVVAFYDRLLERTRALPGVSDVALTSALPIGGAPTWSADATIEGQSEYVAEFRHRTVTPEYFDTLRVRLLEGRVIEAADSGEAGLVAVVNETFARHAEDGSLVGRRIKLAKPDQEGTWLTVVGIVADEKYRELDEPSPPQIYQPFAQRPRTVMSIVLRTTTDPEALVPQLRSTVAQLEPSLALAEIATLQGHIRDVLAEERFVAQLVGALAVLAIVLAAVGIYGVMSYSVGLRRQEFGIRMALGAQVGDLLGMVLRQGFWIAAIGVLAGLAVTLAVSRVFASLLFQVSPYDPLTLAAGTLLLLTIALIACYLPARRATAVDPQTTLRAE